MQLPFPTLPAVGSAHSGTETTQHRATPVEADNAHDDPGGASARAPHDAPDRMRPVSDAHSVGRWATVNKRTKRHKPAEDGAAVPEGRPAREWRTQRPLSFLARRAIAVPLGIAVTVFLVAVFATLALVWAEPGTDAAPFVEADAGETLEPATPADEIPTDEGAAPQLLLVHVAGEVSHAGVVEVPAGARVTDAIEAAGGLSEDAVLDNVNLARPVVDGEHIRIPNATDPLPASTPPGSVSSGTSGTVSLNQGTAADFETLPGIGPALAERIVNWRETHGGFNAIDQLGEVSGIGEKTLTELRELVTL